MERGGGILLALGLLFGAGIGVAFGNGALGMVGGLVVGGLAAWGFARHDARRRK